MHSLRAQLGLFRGFWAAGVFSLFERSPEPGELAMDGIAVCDVTLPVAIQFCRQARDTPAENHGH
jgi:hypothetical protein